MTEKPKEDFRPRLLLERAARVDFFARTFAGKSNDLIEGSAIHVLETYHGPWGAVWFHFRRTLRWSLMHMRGNLRFHAQLFWLRRIKRMTDEQIDAHFAAELESE